METTIKTLKELINRVEKFNPEFSEAYKDLATVLSFVPENKNEIYVRQERTREQADKIMDLLGNINSLCKVYFQACEYRNRVCSAYNRQEDSENRELYSKFRSYLEHDKFELLMILEQLIHRRFQ